MLGLPQISNVGDVYETGVLCQASVKEDPQNPFAKYILNLHPQEKCKIKEQLPDDGSGLLNVSVETSKEKHIFEEQLTND